MEVVVMKELKPCPFCGSEWHEDDDDGWIRIDHLKDCYLSAISSSTTWFIKQSMDKTWFAEHWNTRAERTCEVTEYNDCGPHAEDCTIVLSCGHRTLGYIPNYCPSCGAKVVE